MEKNPKEIQEANFRLVIEAAPNAMIMVDTKGKINLINAQVEKLFGYNREELLGQTIEIVIPQRFRDKHPTYRADFSKQPESRPMGKGRDLFGLRKDGTEVPIEIGLNPLKTTEGTFVLAAIIDITERKKSRDELELRVQERTQELEKSRRAALNLMQDALEAKKMAESTKEELMVRVKEIEKLNEIMMGREEKILELKQEIKRLKDDS